VLFADLLAIFSIFVYDKLIICLLACLISRLSNPGADGIVVNCEHPEGGDGEDFKLQHIFDELFEGFFVEL
jgi:hypothetical protein